MQAYLDALQNAELVRRLGKVACVTGQSIESCGPQTTIGEICEVEKKGTTPLLAEVVSIRPGKIVLMPYGDLQGIGGDCRVTATGKTPQLAVGKALLGRVVDAFGEPMDGKGTLHTTDNRPLYSAPMNPLSRPHIGKIVETGVRAIDGLMPIGSGQRMGIFAGSGVGKSTLLGMLARDVRTDINVIALIGERGREVREFVEKHLGEEGLARSVVVVATSDQPALLRARAAYAATAIAEYFREQGAQVMLMMDSITRFAMARREIGLAAGEPPTARGYTPSVFAEIPALCERCGTSDSGGSITAFYTVLVEGDDFNEPVSDMVRATLDGHIMLSRELAHEGHFPAIDILQSTSRLASQLADKKEQATMHGIVHLAAVYERNRQMVSMGVYKAGSDAEIDRAIKLYPAIRDVLRQSRDESSPRSATMSALKKIMDMA